MKKATVATSQVLSHHKKLMTTSCNDYQLDSPEEGISVVIGSPLGQY